MTDNDLDIRIQCFQSLLQLFWASCMVPVLVCVQYMRNHMLREITTHVVENDGRIGWVNQHELLFCCPWNNVRIVVLKEGDGDHSVVSFESLHLLSYSPNSYQFFGLSPKNKSTASNDDWWGWVPIWDININFVALFELDVEIVRLSL